MTSTCNSFNLRRSVIPSSKEINASKNAHANLHLENLIVSNISAKKEHHVTRRMVCEDVIRENKVRCDAVCRFETCAILKLFQICLMCCSENVKFLGAIPSALRRYWARLMVPCH